MDKMNALIDYANQIENNSEGSYFGALVSIDRFFDGNEDRDSIAVHIDPHPGTKRFKEILKTLESNDQVQSVWVEITDIDPTCWPYSERVIIITTLEAQAVLELIEDELEPDEVADLEIDEDIQLPKYQSSSGFKVVGIWWD